MMYFLLMSQRTAFFKLEDLFPECFLYREKHPQIEPAICIAEDAACTVGKNCMETLAKRLKVLFDELLVDTDLILLYYRKRNLPGIGAAIFWRSFEEPRLITVNPTAWEKIKKRGSVYQFTPGPSFFLTGKAPDAVAPQNQDTSVLDG